MTTDAVIDLSDRSRNCWPELSKLSPVPFGREEQSWVDSSVTHEEQSHVSVTCTYPGQGQTFPFVHRAASKGSCVSEGKVILKRKLPWWATAGGILLESPAKRYGSAAVAKQKEDCKELKPL